MSDWRPDSWRNMPIVQVPSYPDQNELKQVEEELSSYPPLVFAGEARNLKAHLADVSAGKAFCCKVGIVQRVLQSFTLTTLGIPSVFSFKWQSCSLSLPAAPSLK